MPGNYAKSCVSTRALACWLQVKNWCTIRCYWTSLLGKRTSECRYHRFTDSQLPEMRFRLSLLFGRGSTKWKDQWESVSRGTVCWAYAGNGAFSRVDVQKEEIQQWRQAPVWVARLDVVRKCKNANIYAERLPKWENWAPRRAKVSPRARRGNQNGPNGKQKGTKSEPKGTEREPNWWPNST